MKLFSLGVKSKNLSRIREKENLLKELEASKRDIEAASSWFKEAVEPEMIDSCIYELNAARMKYSYLCHRAKQIALTAQTIDTLNGD